MSNVESSRLRAVQAYSILDTPPEPNFDRITSLAATIFGLPFAMLSFADAERHWIKARYGASVSEIPRRMSFCDETIRSDDVFIVPDALADSRFAAAPVVAGPPHVRFYAGAPLVSPEGLRVGSLCVLDRHPHADFSHWQASVLHNLARTVVELLEARKRELRLAQLHEEIAHLASHDPLTGLANRRLLRQQVEQALAGAGEGEEALVLYLDLDHFKVVNDSLGHHAGDAVLQEVANRLRRTVRDSDKVARLGGDEFAIVEVCPQASARAADLADRIIAAISEPYEIDGQGVTIGASIGIAFCRGGSARPEQLLKEADNALYCAKSNGRGRRVFYHAEMQRDDHRPAAVRAVAQAR